MKQLSVLIKPASAACNLRCKYCFYTDISHIRATASHGRMTEETVDAILENLRQELQPGDSVTFAFQGGEPTLAGLNFFRYFVSGVSRWNPGIAVRYALQTNGVLLDDGWCGFLKEYDFLVGLSMDLLPREHNDVRVDVHGEGSWKQACAALALLKKHGVEHNVLCTLTRRIARHPWEVWKQIGRLELKFVQFTPCLDSLENPGQSPYALEPALFSGFYKELFSLWLRDFRAGKYRSIKLFDDLVNLLAFGWRTACGITGQCQRQIVVEADGSVYPCDFFCLDTYCLGNLTQTPISRLLNAPAAQAFVDRLHTQPKLCADCPFRKICGGNCKRMQQTICCAPEADFCGYRDFLNSCYRDLAVIALQQRSYRRGRAAD